MYVLTINSFSILTSTFRGDATSFGKRYANEASCRGLSLMYKCAASNGSTGMEKIGRQQWQASICVVGKSSILLVFPVLRHRKSNAEVD